METVKDYISTYVEFQVLLADAKAMLEALRSKNNALIPSIDRMDAAEMQVRIDNQRTYISRLEQIVKDWADAIACLGQTYKKEEYEMFVTLIVKGVPPAKTKWSKSKCYKFMNQVFQDMKKLEEKL